MSQPLINPNQKPPKEKKSDSRQWYQKKRWMLPIGFFVFVSIMSAITGGGDSTESSPTETVTQTATATATSEPVEETAEEEAVEVVPLVIPDLVGQNSMDASDELEELGFLEVNVQDASREERIPFLYSNWYVCEMRPASGQTLNSDKTIVLLSVKNSEACPGPGSSNASGGADSSSGGNSSAEISAGTYVVGSEIEPGFYRSSRYWSRLDANQDIIDNDLVWGDGWTLVEIKSSDKYIEFSGVAYALEDMPVLDPIAEGFTEGSYLVGVDIQPGTYRINAEGDSMAYGSRLACDRDILDNDLNSGSVILTVKSSDCMFEFRGILEKLD